MLTREVKVVYLLHVLASSILAAGDEVYGKKGGEITLTPDPFTPPLKRIVWKHGDDKAIEWEGEQTDAYRQFRDSTFLDTKTGKMTIKNLDSRFIGVYSSDVNGIQATKRWTLTLLDPVSKPIINMSYTESKCVLTCENKATFKVKYAWRMGEEELQKYNRTLEVEKTDTVGKVYTCNFSNPVSFAVSDPVVPFPPDPPVVIIVCVVFLIIIIIVIVVIAFMKRKQLMKFVQTRRGTRGNPDAANEGGAKEAAPLRDTTNGGKPANSP